MSPSRRRGSWFGVVFRNSVARNIVLATLLLALVAFLRFALPPVAEKLHAWRVGAGADVEVIEASFGKIFSRISAEDSRRLEREFAAFFEAFLKDFGSQFELRDLELSDLAITLDLWEDHEALARYYENTHYEDFSNNGGYYDPSTRTIAIVGKARDYLDVRRSAFHEATHLIFDVFSSQSGSRFPLWLAEGLAVYFEGASVEGNRVRIGGRDRLTPALVRVARTAWGIARLEELAGDKIRPSEGLLPSLSRLMAAGPKEFRSEVNHVFYAESMLLVHYLLEEAGTEVRDRFIGLCRGNPGHLRTPASLERALDLSEGSLDKGFADFLAEFLFPE